MPSKPKRLCIHCGSAVHGKCQRCERKRARAYENNAERSDDRAFYSSKVWRAVRAVELAKRPLCECDDCKRDGRLLEANLLHHIKPRKTHPHLALDPSNLQAVNHACHSRIEGRLRGKANF